MDSDYLTSPFDNLLKPVDEHLIVHNGLLSPLILGNSINIHTNESGLPDLDSTDIALIGVPENRNSLEYLGEEINLNEIRKSFYNLFPGNWSCNISDLGNLILSDNAEETYGRLDIKVKFSGLIAIVIALEFLLTSSILTELKANSERTLDISTSLKSNTFI